MSLINFHRFLIAAAIAFCFGFAGWEVAAYRRSGDTSQLYFGAIFVVAGLLLVYYLYRLRDFLDLSGDDRR